MERWLLPAADTILALTPSTARLLRADGIPDGRVQVIPPGYDPALFAAPSADPFPGLPRPRVAYLGRLAPQKDVGTLLEAFALLPAATQLLLVGDGPDRAALQRRAQDFGGRVHITGFIPHAAVPAVLAHVDLLVLPSLYEDLSSALIEAMAAGRPVVATRVGGTADLVRHGVNGLLGSPPRPGRAGRRDQPDPGRSGGGRPDVGRRAEHGSRLRMARPGPPGAGGLPARNRPPPQPPNHRHRCSYLNGQRLDHNPADTRVRTAVLAASTTRIVPRTWKRPQGAARSLAH